MEEWCGRMHGWLVTLRPFLLKTNKAKHYTNEQMAEFDDTVKDIQAKWVETTNISTFPKLMCLSASVGFAKIHGFLADARKREHPEKDHQTKRKRNATKKTSHPTPNPLQIRTYPPSKIFYTCPNIFC
jgi:hypothetical protein